LIATILGALLLSACSRESADWKSASTADTAEAYQQFLTQHPKAANAPAAQARLKALSEDHDWQVAAAADTRAAYEQFIAAHTDSKWAQEARIRIENFAQNGTSSTTGSPEPAATASTAPVPAKSAAAKSAAASKVASASAKSSTAKSGAAAHGNFVQLGAFSSKERAQSEWKTLAARFPTELKSLKPDYVQGTSKHGTVYRLRVPVSSVAAGKGLCGTLKKHSQLCVPVTA
jgi:cell division septation protein DedD